MSKELGKPKDLSVLLPEEKEAYDEYIGSKAPPLSPAVSSQLYELFLNGNSCQEIARLNPNFSLGMIVRARVDQFWDLKREAHLSDLLEGVRGRVQQTQLEAVAFVSGLMSAIHKFQGDKIKMFLQTGDESILASLGGMVSFKAYKEAVTLLLQLTGQDREQKIAGEVLHKFQDSEDSSVKSKPVSPQLAAKFLKALEEEEGGK